jgi:hypothetical protein
MVNPSIGCVPLVVHFFGIKSQATVAKPVFHYVCKIALLLPKTTGTLDENKGACLPDDS